MGWIAKNILYLTGAIVVLTIIVASASSFIFQDFSIYHKATSLWLEGKNPYLLPAHQSYMEGYLGEVSPVTNISMRVLAPPYFLVTMMPFALLKHELAKIFYLLSLVAGFLVWLSLTIKVLHKGNTQSGRWRVWEVMSAMLTQPY